MPRYHFHIFDGRDLRDEDGVEFSDFETACVEAIRSAGEILKDEAHRIAHGVDWHMDVTDETGLILLRLDFSVLASSAVPHSSEAEQKPVAPHDLRLVR